MKWLFVGLAVLVVTGAIVAAVGSRVPREHVASVQARFTASPEAVWALISAPANYASWRTDLTSVALNAPRDGRTAWTETSRNGAIAYEITESVAPSRLVTHITDESLPYGGQWEFTLEPSGSGAVLTIVERGFVQPVFFRFMARYLFGYTATLAGYQRSLAAKLGETSAAPIVIASGH